MRGLILIELRNNITEILTSTTFSGIYEAISEVNTHLSVPEKLWATWYAWWRNDTLATGLSRRIPPFLNWQLIHCSSRYYELCNARISLFRSFNPLDCY